MTKREKLRAVIVTANPESPLLAVRRNIEVVGRYAQTLMALVEAGPRGVTALEMSSWTLRLSHYIFILRTRDGLNIETQNEPHDGGTYIKVKGQWCYLYRAVDKAGFTIDFLLTKRRQRMSAQSFLIKAITNNGKPELINIDKSGSNTHAIRVYNKRSYSNIKIRQCKYLNNIVEQDHRFIKKRIIGGLGFKEFESARRTIAGIELVHMIKKEQLISNKKSIFKSFCSLVA